jgi:glycosyltransferase involved in cell wall biosynthesis
VQAKATFVPNPADSVAAEGTLDDTGDRRSRYRIVGVGRLVPQKGFDLLIEAFASVAAKFPAWDLEIWGEGPERTELTRLIEVRGLHERARLAGSTPDIEAVLHGADIFVLPSRYEGFPNALLEAMSHGVAAIAFDCPGANSDIIEIGVNGILVKERGSVVGLSDALAELMSDASKRAALGREARRVVDKFSPRVVLDMWDAVIARASGGESPSSTTLS